MMTMEAVGNVGGGKVDAFGDGGQGERKRRHQDDHQ